MKGEFRLTGLSRPRSMTCETDKEVSFWPTVTLKEQGFDALWDFCNSHWEEKKIAVIEHDGLTEDGTPINPVFVEMKEV